jgi:ATP-dependent Clp protease ATP-binding subunit ClpC
MRVTECAQRAVLHARLEAGRLGHDRVGTEHLLLALLRDQGCLASATLGERGVEVEAVRRRVEETAGPGPVEAGPGERDELAGQRLPTTKPFTLVLGLAGREALELEHDRVGTEHLLLGLAREGDGVAARVLEDLGAGLLQLREAVISLYSAGVDPEPPPPDRGPPPWEPPAGARLRRVVPLASEHPLPSGDLLVLLSLEIWSDWFDLRYPAFGRVRVRHHSFVPAPPPGTEVLELRFGPPSAVVPGEAPPLVVSTVVL